jgi:uncharacterized membrane protein YccF (DUF307 family)|tara:strand:- start:10 stop:489 length:480 start_codon:yes stop_codon:yes gene_type:complete
MAFIGNIVWFVFGGWLLGTLYLVGAIILFPLLPFLMPMVSYAYWPFGRRPVSKKAVAAYKVENNMPADDDKFAKSSAVIKFLATTVWVLTFGWILAIAHLLSGVANLFACIFIVTIPVALPNALANFKLIPVAFAPFGVRLIPTSLADDIDKSMAKSKL